MEARRVPQVRFVNLGPGVAVSIRRNRDAGTPPPVFEGGVLDDSRQRTVKIVIPGSARGICFCPPLPRHSVLSVRSLNFPIQTDNPSLRQNRNRRRTHLADHSVLHRSIAVVKRCEINPMPCSKGLHLHNPLRSDEPSSPRERFEPALQSKSYALE